MIELIHREWQRAFKNLDPAPTSALEVGALPDWRGLLAGQDWPRRVGINLTEEGVYEGVEVIQADARELPFEDASFDLVVSNSTLEHIPDFWRAAEEMRRVLAPGGTLLLCMPGYTSTPAGNRVRRLAGKMPVPDLLKRGTVTMRVHDKRDYYRFGEHAFEDYLLEGLEDVRIWTVMTPPRVFGSGRKPRDAS